ncbi:MAG TPA: carbohydrate kinase [Clostridiales bacterium]|nr:carbohydrate kinase [Clostridiales bacterium]
MKDKLLGIDAGNTLIKAALYDLNGNELASAGLSTKSITPATGYNERDMDEFYQAVCYTVKEVIQAAGINSEEIACISLTGHGKGLYLWGKDNAPAYNGILSTDTRADSYIKEWYSAGLNRIVYPSTMQSILVSQPCVLLRWMKDNKPDVYRNIKWVFEAKDYIRFRLTGEAYAEITDYSGTSLMNLPSRKFDPFLFEQFGIPEMLDCMPPVRDSFDICGYITKEAAQLTGLCEGTPVAGGMFDIDSSALAMNIADESSICVIAGTWSINEYISKTPVTDGSVAMNSIYCLPDYYLIEESSPTSAGNLEWFVKNILDTDYSIKGKSIYKYVDSLVNSISSDDCDLFFLPHIYGNSINPSARGAFIGLSSKHTKAHMLRAIFEGIVFNHYFHIERLLSSRDKPKSMRLAGGAANSAVWVQMFADVIGLPTEVVRINELGTLGCAVNAAVACGLYENINAAIENMTHAPLLIEPNMETHNAYKAKYLKYKQIVQLLDPLWDL